MISMTPNPTTHVPNLLTSIRSLILTFIPPLLELMVSVPWAHFLEFEHRNWTFGIPQKNPWIRASPLLDSVIQLSFSRRSFEVFSYNWSPNKPPLPLGEGGVPDPTKGVGEWAETRPQGAPREGPLEASAHALM